MRRFLDTDVCVAFLRGTSAPVRERLLGLPRQGVALPAMVVAELRVGAEKSADPGRQTRNVEGFVRPFAVVPFDEAAAQHYARVRAVLEREGRPIGANDYVIAATVMAQGGVLVTLNLRHFRQVRGLSLEDWASR